MSLYAKTLTEEQLLERVLKDDWTGLNERDVKKKKRKKRAVGMEQ